MKKTIFYFFILTSMNFFVAPAIAEDTDSPDEEIEIPTGNVSEEVEKTSGNQMMMATLTGGGAIYAGTKAMTCCAKKACPPCKFYMALTAGLTAATVALYEESQDNKKLSRDFRDDYIKCLMKGTAFQWDPAANFCKPKKELCEKDGGTWDFATSPPCQFPVEDCEEGEEKRAGECVSKTECLIPGYEKNEDGICAPKDTTLKSSPCKEGYKLDETTGKCKKSSSSETDKTLGGGGCPEPLVPDKKKKDKCLPKLPDEMKWDKDTETISMPAYGVSASADEMEEALQNLSPADIAPIKSALEAITSSAPELDEEGEDSKKDSDLGGGGSTSSRSGFGGYVSKGSRRGLSSFGGGGGALLAKNANYKKGKRKKKGKDNFLTVDPNSIFYLIHRRYQIKRKRKEFLQ